MDSNPSALQQLRDTVRTLRSPEGCPWDREQTHQSLTEHLIEEVSELLEVIDQPDYPKMREELGDVLLQVVLHAQIAEESGAFDLDSVATEIKEKLIRRHPHVFGDVEVSDSAGVLHVWDRIKAEENPDRATGRFKPLPPKLPALLYARDVFKQIEKQEMDASAWIAPEEIESLAEDLDEAEAGALLFRVAAACHRNRIDPEAALRRYSDRLIAHLDDGR